MSFRFPFVLAGCSMLAGFAIGQTSDSAKELPSAPSATAQEQAPPKQAPPTNDSKPPAQPPRQKPDQELKLGEHIVKAPPPAADTAEPKTDPPAQSTDPAVPPATSPTQPAPAPGVPHLEDVPQGPEDSPAATFIRFANEVRVIFTVTDKRGRYIKDLKREDFKVLDDRKPAVRINSFDAQTNLPLQVALLIDASNSIRDRFKFEQEAAIEFLNSIIRPRFDQAMTVGFDSTPDVTQDFTDNTELLSKGVRALKAGGGTAMYDALYATCRDHLLKQQQTGPVRRAIILLSDGDDNSSHVTREEAIEMAQRSEVIVYTISTNITGSKSKSDKVLERIAEATGGRAFFPFQIRDVSDAFASIQDELRSQYAMSYRPADLVADGHFRTIEILAQQKAFHVRTRKGYYAPKR